MTLDMPTMSVVVCLLHACAWHHQHCWGWPEMQVQRWQQQKHEDE
jgi:hypothetical protein